MTDPESKLARLRSGKPPRFLDLFAGCGGFSLGFVSQGFVNIGGVEKDPHAAASHGRNFHGFRGTTREAKEHPHARPRDILSQDPVSLLHEYGAEHPESQVDVIIGGPPCPAFTRVGRAKLREVHAHPEAFKEDPRWRLYIPYLEYVRVLRPVGIVMENVPDLLNFGGYNLAEEIADTLESLGYRVRYTLLNASSYGVPQMRERFILFALHECVGADPSFPTPSRYVDFPRGYHGSRDVALKVVNECRLSGDLTRYVDPPQALPSLPGPVTVAEAIADLPVVSGPEQKRGARRFDTLARYAASTPSRYAGLMRNWPGFESGEGVVDHVTRALSDRDFRLFRGMAPGDDYPKAHALAMSFFRDEVRRRRRSGQHLVEGGDAWAALRKEYVPPYSALKFPNKWRKMHPEKPARTLMAHLGKDSYTHIHYDSEQARVLTVREAARLQSFPDGFTFCGTMNPAFRQIGNAVPPLFSAALAGHLRGLMEGKSPRRDFSVQVRSKETEQLRLELL